MGKIIETTIKDFQTGISNDPRAGAQCVSNFDIFTDPRRMTPYRDSEDGSTDQANIKIQNFCTAVRTGTTYSLYGLGVTSGGGIGEFYYKDLTTGASNDLDDNAWAETANNADGGGAANFNLCVYYQRRDRIFFATGGTTIGSYDPDGSSSFDDEAHNISYTNIAQGLVHSKDDILYIPYDNKIAKNNNNSWTDAALTLPEHFYITSICEYGDYLAIACAPLSGVGASRVYLWDRDSSLTTISESIDWGEGKLQILEELEGYLVGVSIFADSTRIRNRIVFRVFDGSTAVRFQEFTSSSSPALPITKQKVDNRIYFLMQLTLNGAVREGLWSVSRANGRFAITHERTHNNDTALSTGTLRGFFVLGDYAFIAYNSAAGTHVMSKTNDASSHTATSIYESQIFNGDDASLKKKLIGLSVTTEPLPSAGQVVVKYKKDAETSFTTILTQATDDSISDSAINIESSGATLPEYKEISFRIESTGGAVITGFSFKEEITGKRAYD